MDELFDAFSPICRTFSRASLGAIVHNGQVTRRQFPRQKILSVLKADCFGHGIEGGHARL